jgi:Protein of unknown function (DUF1592)/Protein of unknown function (DUF1588)/Protein of unknown function (DUF1585)/Protein of unknown function (DUF1595)/Protein of unknown function (DUF1587)
MSSDRQKVMRCVFLPMLIGAVALAPGSLRAQDRQHPGVATTSTAAGNWPMLDSYCGKCHNATDWAGGVAFDAMQASDIPSDAKTWEAAISKLRGRMMPPPGEKQPPQPMIDRFVAGMEATLDAAAPADPKSGFVSLHRLSRTEYGRSVQEVTGLTVDASQLLPADTKNEDGFENIADVLTVSPTFLFQYIVAARSVAEQAIGNPHPLMAKVTLDGDYYANQNFHVEGLPLGTRGGLLAAHYFPADGDYVFDINISVGGISTGRVYPGYVEGLDDPRTVILTIDGQQVFEQTIGGAKDLKEADQDPIRSSKDLHDRFSDIHVAVTAGPHQLGVTFVGRTYAESDEMLQPLDPMGGEGRAPRIAAVEIRGPHDPTGLSETPSRRRIFSCYPKTPAEEDPCAQQIISVLARRAYRRPVDADDLTAPLRFYRAGLKEGGTFDAGIKDALMSILASPKFLYRVPEVPTGTAPGTTFRLSDFDLATRLSFMLWSQGPDGALLDAAIAGKLTDPQVLARQVDRMLVDPRATSLTTNFAFEWLEVGKMDQVKPDPTVYPSFDAALRADLGQEMYLFVDSVLRSDQSVLTLLTADYTFLNARLARLYDVPNVSGSQFRRVKLTDSHRFGLLGKGAMLLGTSYGNRTAPVLRGSWVLDTITDTPPVAPPPNIAPLKENVAGATPLTIRQRMEEHRSNFSCNACHGILDPIGMSLENFDAIGKWRDKDPDTGTPIDASGRMSDGTSLGGPGDLRAYLRKHPQQFVQTVTEKLMTFALGRNLDYHDMPTIRAIVRDSAQHGYTFRSLVLGIVNSKPFQEQPLPPAGPDGKPATQVAQQR